MRIVRAAIEPGFIAVDNSAEDADLSCRAFGLLARWLRCAPGEEIAPIPDMVKQRKRRGCKRIEGRDSLYTASYELEAEGFLVRRLEPTRGGSEWVAYVYPSPVPVAERSNPDDRKRTQGKPRAGKTAARGCGRRPDGCRVVPESQGSALTCENEVIPESQGSGGVIPEIQELHVQGSSTRKLSFSLSGAPLVASDPAASAETVTGERDAATPNNNPAPAAAAASVPPPRSEQQQQEADPHLGTAADLLTGLPARLGGKTVTSLAPLAAAALAGGYTPETLRAELDRRINVRRIKFEGALPGLYRDVLLDLPPAPAARPAGARIIEPCPDHPGRRRGRCVECALAVPD